MKKSVIAITAVLLLTGLAAASTGLDDCDGDMCAMDTGDSVEDNTSETPDVAPPEEQGFFGQLVDGIVSSIAGLFD